MLVNFASESVGTTVVSDKVSIDNHECSNLISDNWRIRKQGFIAEHFIKPPVNLTFQFPCSVHIHQVFLNPFVGQQLTSQVEVYSATDPKIRHGHRNNDRKIQQSIGNTTLMKPATSYTNGCSDSPFSTPSNLAEPPPLFYQVSKASVTGCGRVCFTNPTFTSQNSSSSEDTSICLFQSTLRHFRRETLAASTHISIRLMHTKHGSSAAVGLIDIWGTPATSVPVSIKEDVVSKYLNSKLNNHSCEYQKHEFANKGEKAAVSSIADDPQKELQDLSIPDEFVDPITCDVMSIPMLLPSAKNVDLSTLERFNKSEASCGRLPRDPFTGIIFSAGSKPIPNTALKSRIDQFLSKHSDNKFISSVARTVNGKSRSSLLGKRGLNGHRLSDGISCLIRPKDIPSLSQPSPAKVIDSSTINFTHRTPAAASSCFVQKKTSPRFSNCGKSEVHIHTDTEARRILPVNITHIGNSEPSSSTSHDDRLKKSLSSALISILGTSGTGVSSKTCTSIEADNTNKCSSCDENLSSSVVYKSPCHHVICRKCLTTKQSLLASSIKCNFCGKHCNKKDYVRQHQV